MSRRRRAARRGQRGERPPVCCPSGRSSGSGSRRERGSGSEAGRGEDREPAGRLRVPGCVPDVMSADGASHPNPCLDPIAQRACRTGSRVAGPRVTRAVLAIRLRPEPRTASRPRTTRKMLPVVVSDQPETLASSPITQVRRTRRTIRPRQPRQPLTLHPARPARSRRAGPAASGVH
jgi:hypothetical protein